MWSQGSCPLGEYVQPSLEATKTCITCSALGWGAPAALVAVILAPSSVNGWRPLAGTVREADNQSFCRFFLYAQKSPVSQSGVSYLTPLFLLQQISLPLIFSFAFLWTFASSAIKLLRDFVAQLYMIPLQFFTVLVLTILNNSILDKLSHFTLF